MLLTIDTTERNRIEIGLYKNNKLKCFEFETKLQSEDLLLAIDGILQKEKLSLKDFRAILTNLGPGSFTGSRVGVTVANTLAWVLDIPVFGFRQENLDQVLAKVSNSKLDKFSKPLIPYYSACSDPPLRGLPPS